MACRPSSSGRSPTTTTSTGTPCACSTSAAASSSAARSVPSVSAGVLEQPAAQVALLGPGQRHDRARVVGLALDQRQRLQHRVVQVRGHVGLLLLQDPLAALVVELAQQPPHQWPGDQAEPEGDDHEQQDRAADLGRPPAAHQEGQHGDHDEQQAADHAHDGHPGPLAGARHGGQSAPGTSLEPGPLARVGLRPEQREAGAGDQHRHGHGQRQAPAGAVQQQQQPDGERAEGDQLTQVVRPDRPARTPSAAVRRGQTRGFVVRALRRARRSTARRTARARIRPARTAARTRSAPSARAGAGAPPGRRRHR